METTEQQCVADFGGCTVLRFWARPCPAHAQPSMNLDLDYSLGPPHCSMMSLLCLNTMTVTRRGFCRLEAVVTPPRTTKN